MDHRCGTRYTLDAPVRLSGHGLCGVAGRIREASISGMFVEAPAELFADHSVIDVEVTLPGVAALRTYRWQAMVVRHTDAGLGLMFDRLRPPAISRLLAGTDMPLGAAASGQNFQVTPSEGISRGQ
ncbi:MAG: PilZ domain-containing protein [Gammaproteobacteria bacterium]|nr:PilZ domain-containing protein [Gammaproteobacteria bacterium]